MTSIAKESPHGSQAPPTRPRIASRATSIDTTPATRIRLPSSWRNVTARLLRPRAGERSRTARREVPEIRLSGAWLERIGFPKGAEYLVSVEREFRTIILQASFDQTNGSRRR